jgi:hypothetical protein
LYNTSPQNPPPATPPHPPPPLPGRATPPPNRFRKASASPGRAPCVKPTHGRSRRAIHFDGHRRSECGRDAQEPPVSASYCGQEDSGSFDDTTGIQSRAPRRDGPRGEPRVSAEQNLFDLATQRLENAALCAGVDVSRVSHSHDRDMNAAVNLRQEAKSARRGSSPVFA